MNEPMINLPPDRVYKDCGGIIGMRQGGKTNFLLWLLSQTQARYVVFDTLGIVKRSGFTPLFPQKQRIVTPLNWEAIKPLWKKTATEIWNAGNTMLFIDEISVRHEDARGKLKPYFCDKWWIDGNLVKIANQGGNRNICLWFTSQRVAQVHNDLLANVDHHFIFKIYLPQDLEWYGKVVPASIIEASKNLEPFAFIYYQLGHAPQFCKPVKKML